MTDESNGVGYIDGRYCARSELCIPVTDLGFVMGDLAYDALHVRDGSFFRMEEHLDRFERSIERRGYATFPCKRDEIRDILTECVRRAGLRDSMVMFIATRGEPVGFTKDLRTCRNRFIAWSSHYYSIVSQEQVDNGMALIVSRVQRIPSESVDPTVKNFGRLDFCAALMEAYDHGCEHAVLLDAEGAVTEGRGWNIFACRDGALVSPDSGVLEGITRQTVLELAAHGNVDARLGRLTESDLKAADEVFISTSAGGLIPVVRIDDAPVGDGAPGPVTRRLTDLYWDMHRDPQHRTEVVYEVAQDQAQAQAT